MKNDQINSRSQYSIYLVIVFFLTLVSSCGSDDKLEAVANKYLVSSTQVSSYNTLLLQIGAGQQGLSSISNQLKYNIAIYKIEYKTQFLDSETTASGLIGIPDTQEEMPILSFQHGTIVANSDAPTSSSEGEFYASFASLGYITLIPDFIGFGSSSDIIHPYYSENLMAESVIDMIRAANEFVKENGINSNDKLFLAGYSEGGYATMVTHKAIEAKYSDEFDLIASAPASGGYDLISMKNYLLSLDTYTQPFYLAFLATSYANINGWTTLLSDLFNEPYALVIPDLFDGSNSGSQINAALSTDIKILLTEDFRLNSESDAKFSSFNQALTDNSPVSWQPTHPVYMYHGTEDITVPFENSRSTYNKLLDAGASADRVSFISLKGEDHDSGITPYIISVLAVFEDLK